jgi:hypothetical protein
MRSSFGRASRNWCFNSSKPLHPELFDILAVRKFERDDYQVRLWITRTGHVVTFENEHVLLTEVADADQPFSSQRRLLRYVMRGEHFGRFQCVNGILYQTSFQVETLPEAIYQHVHDEIVADGNQRGVLHHFQPSHRFALSPLGFVVVEARVHRLHVATFHTFPDENTIIKSQTLIEKQ